MGTASSRGRIPAQNDWHFEFGLEYAKQDLNNPTPSDVAPWLCRNDAFSFHKPTIEVKRYRLRQRILMFYHFTTEPGICANCLVRSSDFVYRITDKDTNKGDSIASFISSAFQNGYIRFTTTTVNT